MHKIFRLCGTPANEYWRASRLPLASMFKPQQPYDSTLRERCAELPETAVDLIESLLAIQPAKRGTAASALQSEVCINIHRSIFFRLGLILCVRVRSISTRGRTRATPPACRNSPLTKRWMPKPEKMREGLHLHVFFSFHNQIHYLPIIVVFFQDEGTLNKARNSCSYEKPEENAQDSARNE